MSFHYRHCLFTPAFFPHNRVVPAERLTIVPRMPCEGSRNYNSQCFLRWGGVEAESQSWPGKTTTPRVLRGQLHYRELAEARRRQPRGLGSKAQGQEPQACCVPRL